MKSTNDQMVTLRGQGDGRKTAARLRDPSRNIECGIKDTGRIAIRVRGTPDTPTGERASRRAAVEPEQPRGRVGT